jgi:hypothetical protein
VKSSSVIIFETFLTHIPRQILCDRKRRDDMKRGKTCSGTLYWKNTAVIKITFSERPSYQEFLE